MGALALQLVPVALALGCALTLGGLGALAFGVYALARGGRDEGGGGLGEEILRLLLDGGDRVGA